MHDIFNWAGAQALALEELRERHPREPRSASGPGPWRRGCARTLRALADRLEPAAKPAAADSPSS